MVLLSCDNQSRLCVCSTFAFSCSDPAIWELSKKAVATKSPGGVYKRKFLKLKQIWVHSVQTLLNHFSWKPGTSTQYRHTMSEFNKPTVFIPEILSICMVLHCFQQRRLATLFLLHFLQILRNYYFLFRLRI